MEEAAVNSPQMAPKYFSIFSYGFRPFFLLAGVYAIIPILPWGLYLSGHLQPTVSLQTWHAHEMLFGFVTAGISGFLLSAIPNWTNTPPITGKNLKLLVYYWLIGRFVFWLYLFFDNPIFGYLLFLDLILPVSLTLMFSKVFITTGNKRNFIFIGILLALASANLLVLCELNGLLEEFNFAWAGIGGIFATNIIMIAIAVIGGRVTPNFTRNYLQLKNSAFTICKPSYIEKPAILLIVFNALVDLSMPHTHLSYGVALLAAAVHMWRLSGWGGLKVLDNPIVWVLHLGYLWMVIALLLKGLEGFLTLPYNYYLHSFTVGSIGLYMIGIMSRAALGHTGRPLIVSQLIVAAYILILLAAIIRALAPFLGLYSNAAMVTTIILWSVAYFLYVFVYLPILIRPRIDGKPG